MPSSISARRCVRRACGGDGALCLDTAKGPLATDFVIFCTGFRLDWSRRPEFASFAPHVRLWKDRFVPDPAERDGELDDSPDLGALFEFQEKSAGSCPGLDRLHCFCYPSALSHGAVAGDIPQVSEGARRLAQGLAGRLFTEDIATHFESMQRFAEPELDGDEWVPARFPDYVEDGA